jgi:hypothetical protein
VFSLLHTKEIECLACGQHRMAPATYFHLGDACPRCGYVGWAEPEALTPAERVQIHEELRTLAFARAA